MDELIDQLREAAAVGPDGNLLNAAADALETQGELLQVLGEFVGQYRDEFEESLSYEQQEQYRNYFDLDHSARGYFGADDN